MEKKLNSEQFDEIMTDLVWDENGKTNKKCPLCGNDVVIEVVGRVSTTKCKTPDCFSITGRGI